MRTALISAVKRTGEGTLRSHETIAGRTLLDWQVDLALDSGCERLVCLCDAPSLVLAQQKRVESAGVAFHTARGPLQLAGLVRSEDEVVLLLDGLFVAADAARELLAPETDLVPRLWTLPASHPWGKAKPEDFERIDAQQNWAGLGVIPGDCVRGLGDLSGDGDAFSLLLRLALQAGTPCTPLPETMREGDSWFLASDADARVRREEAMMAASLPAVSWAGPTNALANGLVRSTAPLWLQQAPEISGGLALGLGAIGAGLAGFGYGPAGLMIAGAGAFAGALSDNAFGMRSALGGEGGRRFWRRGLAFAMLLLAVLVLVLASARGEGEDWLVTISLPIFALGLAFIAGQERKSRISAFWQDTPLHLLGFAGAAGLGYLQEVLIVFALAALLQLVLRSTRP